MTLATIHFARPLWLAAGFIAAVGTVLLQVRLATTRRAALAQFGARGRELASSVSRFRRALKQGLVVLGVLAGFGALARPQRGVHWEEAQRRGIDLLFALDTSKSMLAPDLKPNRLVRAKLAVRDLVDKFGGDRVGLLAFAGDAFLQCPLTLDRDIFAQTLEAVDTALIPRGGTDVGRAIEVARDALRNEPANQKLLVLITDGEDLEAHAEEAARAAGKDGIRIYTIGVGTPAGEFIPLADGAGRFVQDESGAFVRSRLDEVSLKAIAEAAGGQYRPLGADGRGLEALYQEVLARLPKQALGSKMRAVPIERFQWPLALAVLGLSLEPLLRERKRRRVQQEPAIAPAARPLRPAMRAALALLCVLGGAGLAQAAPRDEALQYNAGVNAYKSGDMPQAQSAFEGALHAGRPEVQQKAYYNHGNTRFRLGEKSLKDGPEQTIEQWKQAIVDYESALKLDPKDADAAFNRDLVKRKLAELMRQQQKKKESDKQQQNQQGQQSKQDKNQQGQQDKQAQNKNGQQDKQNQSGQQPDKQAQNKNGQPDKQAQNKNGQQDKQNQSGQQQDAQAQNKNGQPDQKSQGTATGPTGSQQEHGEESPVPGQLSRSDAKALLDALRGDERLMPLARTGKRAAHSDDVVRKDW